MSKVSASRRGVIAALALGPIAVAAPSIAIASDDEFDAAVAAYHVAWQALEDHPYARMVSEPEAEIELAYQDSIICSDRASDALRRVLFMPARHLRQVITKIDILQKDFCGGDIPDDLFAFVRDDLIRLAA